MKENKYLFIGGSKDGERLVQEENRIDIPMNSSSESRDPPTEVAFKMESYRKEVFGCQHRDYIKKFSVFIEVNLSTADAMEMLIESYG